MRLKTRNTSRKFIFEQLEPRLLLSADLDPISLAGALPHENIEFVSTAVETGLDTAIIENNTGAAADHLKNEIFFVDTNIQDYNLLINDLLASADSTSKIEIITLDANQNGIEQISEILSQRQDIDTVHIISHGTDGSVKLGNGWLTSDNISSYSDTIGSWQDSLSSEADLLLYGCDLAAGEEGRALVSSLASLTGADVAASDDLTGNAKLGGDWNLEYTVGSIESKVAVSQETQANWSDVLANVTISGTVFQENRTTPISDETVHLIVNGNDKGTVNTDGSGNFSITADISIGENFLIYVDDGNAGGDTVSVAAYTGGSPSLDLYFNHMYISSNLTTTDLEAALGTYDGGNQIGYTVTGTELDVNNTYLYIPSGVTFTPDGIVYVDNMIIAGTIDGGGNTFQVDGDWDASAPLASFTGVPGSTLTFTSGSAATFDPGTTSTYENIILNKGGGREVTLSNNLTAAGDIIITRGNLDVSASNYSITLAGDFVNSDTFTAQNGTVTLTGTNQNISGSTTFYNLSKSVTIADTLTFGAGDTITIAPTGTLTLDGDPGELLTVSSSSPGTHWLLALSPGSFTSLDYLDVSWSDATPSDSSHTPIDPGNSTDSGNNTLWFAAAVNNSPSSSGIDDVVVNVDAPDTVIDLFATFDDAEDADSALAYTIPPGGNTNPGLFTSTLIDGVAGTLTLVYAPGQNGTADITIRATDTGLLYTESTFTVMVNAAPTINGTLAGQAVDDVDFIAPFSGVTIGDIDIPAQTLTVTVTLDDPAYGTFSTLSGFTETGPSTGIFTYSGTAADATTAIRGLVYDPANNRVATGDTETTIFTIDVEDGIAPTVSDSATTVESLSVDIITISGKVFTDEGSSAIADGTTVRVLVNGVSRGTADTFNGDGSYSISNIPVVGGESILVYLDDDGGPGNLDNANDGVTVSVTDGNNQGDFDIYTDHLIVRHDDGGIMTNALMAAAKDTYSDTEIIYTVAGSDLTVNGSDTELYLMDVNPYTPGGDITAPNFETLEDFDGGTFEINISGDLTVSKNTFSGNSSTINVGGDLVLSGGDLDSTSNTLTVAGNFNSTDHSFNHNNGTVILDGSSQSVSGSIHFYNLAKSVSTAATLTFQDGKHIRIDSSGSITLRGETGQLLSLESSTPGSQWDLNLEAGVTTDIEYVAVSDADASSSDGSEIPVNAANSLDVTPLNNIDWFIYPGGTPGGVMDSIQFWIKADDGTLVSGPVSQWDNLVVDGTANGTLPYVEQLVNGAKPIYTADALNYNPVVIFDGANDDLHDSLVDGDDLFQDDQASIFIVEMELFGAGFGVTLQWLDNLDNRVSVEGPGPRFDYGDFDRAPVAESVTGTGLSANYHIINTQVVPSVVGGDPEDFEIYIDGRLDTSYSATNNPLNAGPVGSFSIGDYPLGGFNRNTAIAEVIIYNTDLSAAERMRVESYLAVKYGMTLDQTAPNDYLDSDGNVIWNATFNSTYSNDIAGIGTDVTSGLSQTQSSSINSDSIITVSGASSQDDGDFLLWGNDDGGLSVTASNLPANVTQRLERIWTIEETGDIGTVTISFDISGIAGVTGTAATDFKLIIDSDTTFTGGATIVPAASFAGNIVTFNNVNFSDGQFFALGTDSVNSPVITDGPDTSDLDETDAGLSASGTLTVTDADTTDVVTAAVDSVVVTGTGASSVPAALTNAILKGFLTVTPTAILDNTETTDTLTWDFDSGTEAFNFLATGETLVLTYTVSATDDDATPLSDTETVTVTITGTNDDPVITNGPDTSDLDETDAGLSDTGTLTVTDADKTDVVTAAVDSVVVTGTGASSVPAALTNVILKGFMTVTPTAILDNTETTDTLTWDFDSGSEAFNFLATGETLVLTYTVSATDDDATPLSDTETVTVTITGTNDDPVITNGPDTSDLDETDAGLSDTGTLTVTDADKTDVVTAAVDSVVVTGTGASSVPAALTNVILKGFMTVTPTAILDNTETTDTLTWDFDSGTEAFNFLATGETLVLTYTVSATDDDATPLSDTETVTVTITGTNDDPVITNGPDTSDLDETDAGLSDTGTLTVTDADKTDVVTAAVDSVVVTGTGASSAPAALTNVILKGFLTVTPTAILDNTETTDTLTWNFNSGTEAFNFLADGETLILTYTISATDDDATPLSDTETVTVTITGSNDAPDITVEAGDSAAEGLTKTGSGLTVSDTLTLADVDVTDVVAASVTAVAESGTTSGIANGTLLAMMSITGDLTNAETTDTLNWTFDSGSEAFNYLADGESLILTYTVTATDSQSATDTQNIVITISGANDAPDITVEAGDSAAAGLIETDSGLTVSDTLTLTDVNVTDVVTVSVTSVVESGTTSGIANGTLLAMMSITGDLTNAETTDTLNWTFDSGSEAFDYLADGESLILTYTVTATDSKSANDTQNIVITITGTNDAPVITNGPDTSALTETGAGLTDTGTLTVTDADKTDLVTAAVDSVTVGGTGASSAPAALTNVILKGFLTVTPTAILDNTETTDTLTWNFNSGTEAFNFLADGETLILTYTISATDDDATPLSDTETVTVTITGSNDAPDITVEAGDSAAEGLTKTGSGLTVSDTLTLADVDVTDVVAASVTAVAESGTTSGIANGTLLAMMSITGDLTNAETTDTLNWTFDSGSEAFNYLADGESLILTYTVTATDSQSATDTQNIVITISGANDAPDITVEAGDSAAAGLIETDSGLTVSDTLTLTDVNVTDVVTVSVTSVVESGTTSGIANGTLLAMMSITGDLTNAETTDTLNWTFDSGSEAFDYLADGESLILTYTVTATDSKSANDTQNIVITITGTNDAPVITNGPDTSALTETDAGLTDTGTLTVTDADKTDVVTAAVDSVTVGGTGASSAPAALTNVILKGFLTVTPTAILDNTETTDTLTWNFNSGTEAFNFLADGETLILTYTISATDDDATPLSDTETVTVTITGSNDAPDITVEAGDSAAEGLTKTGSGLTVSDTLTLADVDVTDVVAASVTAVAESGTTSGIANGTLLAMMSITGDLTNAETTDTLNWTFDSGSEAFNYLADGESLILTYTVTATDSQSANDTQNIVITITSSNDAPVITNGPDTSALTETDAGLTDTGTLTVTDADATDTVTAAVDSVTVGGTGASSVPAALTNAILKGFLTVTPTAILDNTETTDTLTWNFNSGTEAFNFLPTGETLILTYKISATDDDASPLSDTETVTVTITGANDTPTLEKPIPDQTGTADTAFSFTFALDTFDDIDVGDTLTYSATLADGTPLPAWISFDPVTREFKSTTAIGDAGGITVEVTADDGHTGGTANEQFNITIDELPVNLGEINDGTDPPPDEGVDEDPPPVEEESPPDIGDEEIIPEETITPDNQTDNETDNHDNSNGEDDNTLETFTNPEPVQFKPIVIASLSPDFYSVNDRSQTSGGNSFKDSSSAEKNVTRRGIKWGVDYRITSNYLRKSFDAMEEETSKEAKLEKTIIGSAIAASTSLSVGYVVWLLRSGMLLSSLLSSMPAWQIADPLPILAKMKENDNDDDDDESIEDIIGDGDTEPDKETMGKDKKSTPGIS